MNERVHNDFKPFFWGSEAEFRLPESALQQTVGWSSETRRPVSLRNYMAERAPRSVRAVLHTADQALHGAVKHVTELTDEELQETVCARLQEGTEHLRLAVVGEDDYSVAELISHVREKTELGRRLVAMTANSIGLLEQLAETGKLHPIEDGAPAVTLPEFEF